MLQEYDYGCVFFLFWSVQTAASTYKNMYNEHLNIDVVPFCKNRCLSVDILCNKNLNKCT